MDGLLVRNAWYVACWDYMLNETGMFATPIAGEPVVVYRGDSGRIVALEDRCCHRAAPLSAGRREGDDLRCMYHGLKFAPDGKCIEIPGQDRIPHHACVKSYPVVERHSWVWVWLGDPLEADEALIPEAVGLDDPNYILHSGYLDYDANYMLINDNLLDFSHLTFVHEATFGHTSLWATTRPDITPLERGVRVSRWLRNDTPPRTSDLAADARVDRWNSYDYLVPGILLMHSGMYAPGSADLSDGKAPPDRLTNLSRAISCQAVTPLDQNRSRYFFSTGPDAATGNAARAERMLEMTKVAFAEDKAMIEAQHRTLSIDPHVKMMPVGADAALSRFRWTMGKLMQKEQPPIQASEAAE